jgi:hypothetical protein
VVGARAARAIRPGDVIAYKAASGPVLGVARVEDASFAVTVRGRTSTKSIEVGHLKCARPARAYAISSASVTRAAPRSRPRPYGLAPSHVGDADLGDLGDLGDGGMAVEAVLDLDRRDVLAARAPAE